MVIIDGNAKVIQTKWDNLYFIFLSHIKYILIYQTQECYRVKNICDYFARMFHEEYTLYTMGEKLDELQLM